MEFSQIFGFLNIFSESIKLIFKNVKLMASITSLSLLLSSILFSLFSLFFQFATSYNPASSSAVFFFLLALVFAVEFTFLFAYIAIARASMIATVIATATSYADSSKLSLQDLFAIVKTTWRSPFRNYSRRPRNLMHFLWIIAAAVAILAVMNYPNPVTITIAIIVGVAFFVAYLYTSVVWTLAAVIPIVEDGCEGAEAVEKAEKLVEGQRLDGFLANLLFYILGGIVVLSFWMIVGDQESLNLTVYGLFLVNSIMLTRIFVSVMYTAYYFRCKEYHGEEIQLPGNLNFHYTALINDVP